MFRDYDLSFKHDGNKLPIHTAAIEAEGKAVFARRPLACGDPIMAHTPVLIVHHVIQHSVHRAE